MGESLQKKGEAAILAALERAKGRVQVAAAELGVPRESLKKALATWASHLRPAVDALRAEDGYSFGRPGVMEREIEKDRFLAAWERNEQRLLAVAKELGVDRDVVRRLARLYEAPGAPPPRRSRRKDDG